MVQSIAKCRKSGPVQTVHRPHPPRRTPAFTLIELLTVVAIISLLISILMPSLSRARDQSKGVHCLARMKDLAIAFSAYENENHDQLPPCEWSPDPKNWPDLDYGWTELAYQYIYKQRVYDRDQTVQASYPVQRNLEPERWQDYFLCKAAGFRGPNSGHYRVYLPSWLMGTYPRDPDGTYDMQNTVPNPRLAGSRSLIPPHMPLIGDSNPQSERIDSSYVDAGDANAPGTTGINGNRFDDRHYGGANFLFQDFSARWERNNYRERLAIDVDLNGVNDVDVVR